MVNVDLLNSVQDEVFADKSLWPREVDGDDITFCNIAALHVANGVGCHAFDPLSGASVPLADQIYNIVKSSPLFQKQPIDTCQDSVNKGELILAILPSWALRQHSGHICTLTTGVGDYSGRWERFTPFFMNLGRAGTCFRQRGVNWAFQSLPEFFMWMSP